MQQQFYRTSILLGEEKVNELATRHVIIAGVGGVGGYVVEAIARAGIGRITIIDHDVVDITNINRQLIATLDSVGKPKVELFVERVLSINPDCKIEAKQKFIAEDNLSELIVDADYVFDCIDSVPSKIALIKYCLHHKIKIISSMGAGNRYDVTKVKIADISKTNSCGLARVMRLGLKKHRISKGLKVIFSEEQGSSPLAQAKGLRPINGTISYLPALFGLMISGYAIKNLIDQKK